MTALELAHILILTATGGYALSTLIYFIGNWMIDPSALRKVSAIFFGLSWLINVAIFVTNWIGCGEPPFGNMYHVIGLLALCAGPLYLLVKYAYKLGWLMPYFTGLAAVSTMGTFFMKTELKWFRMPALRSPWFVPHVSSYIFSYSLMGVAFLLTLVALYKGRDRVFKAAAYRITLLAFPLMTFGLLSGAIWAEDIWGNYWSWDIKEVWSLITWTCYLIYFHCRLKPDLRKWEETAFIIAFAALIITFFVVNKMPQINSLHSYA